MCQAKREWRNINERRGTGYLCVRMVEQALHVRSREDSHCTLYRPASGWTCPASCSHWSRPRNSLRGLKRVDASRDEALVLPSARRKPHCLINVAGPNAPTKIYSCLLFPPESMRDVRSWKLDSQPSVTSSLHASKSSRWHVRVLVTGVYFVLVHLTPL